MSRCEPKLKHTQKLGGKQIHIGTDNARSIAENTASSICRHHYRPAEATRKPTVDELRHILRIKAQVLGLHHMAEPFAGLEPVKLLTFFATVPSLRHAMSKSVGVAMHIVDCRLKRDLKHACEAQVNPDTKV